MRGTCETGLWESFEVDSWVVKVSGQSRDISLKKNPSNFCWQPATFANPDEMGGEVIKYNVIKTVSRGGWKELGGCLLERFLTAAEFYFLLKHILESITHQLLTLQVVVQQP